MAIHIGPRGHRVPESIRWQSVWTIRGACGKAFCHTATFLCRSIAKITSVMEYEKVGGRMKYLQGHEAGRAKRLKINTKTNERASLITLSREHGLKRSKRGRRERPWVWTQSETSDNTTFQQTKKGPNTQQIRDIKTDIQGPKPLRGDYT